MAYNQGFYNLFLAIVTGIGIALVLSNEDDAGVALVLAGIGSMAAAALVLLLSDRSKARAAITQGTLPVLGIVALLVGVLG
jgi:putative membrane protein